MMKSSSGSSSKGRRIWQKTTALSSLEDYRGFVAIDATTITETPSAYTTSSETQGLRTSPSRVYRLSSVSSAKDFLKSVIDDYVLVIHASVRVQYFGRASSSATLAPRIVMTKPDGTLLVHESTKNKPINWQPPGTKFNLSTQGRILVLEAFRRRDREMLILSFDKLFYIAASKVGEGRFTLSGSESDMVDQVMQSPSIIEDGFIPEKREFRTPHGSIDLVGRDNIIDQYNFKAKRESAWRLVAPSVTKETLALLNEKGYDFFKLKLRLKEK